MTEGPWRGPPNFKGFLQYTSVLIGNIRFSRKIMTSYTNRSVCSRGVINKLFFFCNKMLCHIAVYKSIINCGVRSISAFIWGGVVILFLPMIYSTASGTSLVFHCHHCLSSIYAKHLTKSLNHLLKTISRNIP